MSYARLILFPFPISISQMLSDRKNLRNIWNRQPIFNSTSFCNNTKNKGPNF